MFQKLRPKLKLLVGREINVCSNCLDFHSSLLRYSSNTLIFFQYFDRMFQLLGVGCSNCWEFRRVELSCLLIQQLSVESQKLGLQCRQSPESMHFGSYTLEGGIFFITVCVLLSHDQTMTKQMNDKVITGPMWKIHF